MARRQAGAATQQRKRSGAADDTPVVRLHEGDIARIVEGVVAALKRERLVDDVARSVRERLRSRSRP